MALFGGEADVEITVKTGDVKGAGTDSNIFCVLLDEDGKRSRDIKLDCIWQNNFEKGDIDRFKISNVSDIGEIDAIEIWRDDKGMSDDWFLSSIHVKQNDDVIIPFPVHRWILPYKKYQFAKYDCELPQCDARKQQRNEELEYKKTRYCYAEGASDVPRRIKSVPVEESFSSDYLWDIVARKIKLAKDKKLNKIFKSKEWKTFDDMNDTYAKSFGTPSGYFQWRKDEKFGRERLQGCNPVYIRLCEEIPSKFPVTEDMLQPFLERFSLSEAVQNKRLYVIDYEILDGIVCRDGSKNAISPIGLFYVNKEGNLVPIALQLKQIPGDDNPIFLPSDPPNKWMLAKMFFNNADGAIHQACTHLGFTHLLCETICVSMHRSLSPSHPVFRLLAPHFLFLLPINKAGNPALLDEGAAFDQLMNIGSCGVIELIGRRWKHWYMNIDGWLPEDLRTRGVENAVNLPLYHYRDDALLLHNAIHRYVKSTLEHVYDTPEKLAEDFEVQEWAFCLCDSDGAAIKGVFGDGKFNDASDLIKTVTSIIFLASVGHASANFSQYDSYGYPPASPLYINGPLPKNKEEIDDKELMTYLPDKEKTLEIMVTTHLLSDRGTNKLGDFEVQYLFNPVHLNIAKRFQEDLKEISKTINERNWERQYPYTYLDPENIPNSISI